MKNLSYEKSFYIYQETQGPAALLLAQDGRIAEPFNLAFKYFSLL